MTEKIAYSTAKVFTDSFYQILYFGYFAGGVSAQTTDHSILNPDIWINALSSTLFLIVVLFAINLVRSSR